jgi:hypothetical protein
MGGGWRKRGIAALSVSEFNKTQQNSRQKWLKNRLLA